jgi:hypothetical protein
VEPRRPEGRTYRDRQQPKDRPGPHPTAWWASLSTASIVSTNLRQSWPGQAVPSGLGIATATPTATDPPRGWQPAGIAVSRQLGVRAHDAGKWFGSRHTLYSASRTNPNPVLHPVEPFPGCGLDASRRHGIHDPVQVPTYSVRSGSGPNRGGIVVHRPSSPNSRAVISKWLMAIPRSRRWRSTALMSFS